MAEVTGGTWHADLSRLGFNHYIRDQDGRLMATVDTLMSTDDDVTKARAQLIAEVPALREAFKLLWDEYADSGHFEGSGFNDEQRAFLNDLYRRLGGSAMWRTDDDSRG